MIQTPHVSVDGIIELYNSQDVCEGIILIERKNPPLGWALPGGFVDIGESVETALCREMKEETSLEVSITSLLGVYSDPQRDTRFHTVSVVYVCRAHGKPKAADDAKNVKVVSREILEENTLVFDHGKIVADYLDTHKKSVN